MRRLNDRLPWATKHEVNTSLSTTVRIEEGASVGIVVPQRAFFDHPLELQHGEAMLPSFELVYETYGELNQQKSNAILICHALSGDHHAAGIHEDTQAVGWWDNCIGPGKPIDTDRFYVISLNNLGGCRGSTGPNSTNPATNKPYGQTFPLVTVRDWVNTQAELADHLGIERFAAIIGGSLGGMQAMQWAIDFPNRVANAVLIACASNLSAQNIAFNEIARFAIKGDPDFAEGQIPKTGLSLARMIGHVTYLSDDGMAGKFGREIRSGNLDDLDSVLFEVESYLHYQGNKFVDRFDPHTYILMTKALDFFDPAHEYDDDLVRTLSHATARFFVLSFSSDWRFSPERSSEIVDALIAAGCDVSSANIESPNGHDSFLLPIPRYFDVLRNYLATVADGL